MGQDKGSSLRRAAGTSVADPWAEADDGERTEQEIADRNWI